MTKLKYTLIETDADWEENLYHEIVPVRGGYVETDNPLTIEALRYRGYEIVEDIEAKPSRSRKSAPLAA
jgi:hypothetical protein